MPGKYRRYRQLDYQLPKTYLSWELYGAGPDRLGIGGRAVELPLREPNSDEVLLRVDALGLCFSDSKLIRAGPDHPRIRGRDLKNNPTVPGHEASLTVVKAGANWKTRFTPGQRVIVQPDIAIGGEQKSFGYVQRGAMAQYVYAGPWVLDGDGICYLLPIREETGYIEAALVEPWACVEAAYRIADRIRPLSGGKALVVFANSHAAADFSGAYDNPPGTLYVSGEGAQDVSAIGVPPARRLPATPMAVLEAAAATGGFDDIFLVGVPSRELIEACDTALARSGVLCFLSNRDFLIHAALDVGRVHYERTRHNGSTLARAGAAYGANARREILAGGRTWMLGAAGPMGQMHVQRALELPNPPATLVCTDLSGERMDYMRRRLQPLANRQGVALICLDGGAPDLARRLAEAAPGGFDDIVVMAPSARLVEYAAGFLADGCVVNVFAGLPVGSKATLSPDAFSKRHARLIGSSGSSMQDIVNTLEKLESGGLATRMSLAAIGGIETARQGILDLLENRFPGKVAILPQVRGVGLTGLGRLAELSDTAAARLEAGQVWTNAAEQEFFEQFLDI